MKIEEYNSFHNSLEKIIKQQTIADIFAKNTIVYKQTQLNSYLKSITSSLEPIVNNFKYQEILVNYSRLTDIINQNLSPQLKNITSIAYDNLLNCDFTALKNLQNSISNINISDFNIASLDLADNGNIIYNNKDYTPEEVNNATSELLLKASTGTMEYSDIKKHPIISISLMIIMYIIFSLIIPDIYSSVKQYIKDNYLNNTEIIEDDYNNFRIITTEILNVRRNSSTDSDIVGKLYYLNVVKVIDSKPYWLKIEYIDSTNNIQITGWISKKYTSDFSQETDNIFNLNSKK